MAGIVRRKVSAPYTTSMHVGSDKGATFLSESITLTDGSDDGESSFQRRTLLSTCNMDVDAVDASYSLDASLPDFPSSLTGTRTLSHFGIEHCLATSDNSRSRCFVFYGSDDSDDDFDDQLSRIVICHEDRVLPSSPVAISGIPDMPSQLTIKSPQDTQADINRLIETMTGNGAMKPSISDDALVPNMANSLMQRKTDDTEQKQPPLSRHDVSLLEVSSGLWVGDSVVRDVPMVPLSPLQRKGFGNTQKGGSTQLEMVPFGRWTVGVQKTAWRWMWNFGDEIRLVVETGRAMGSELAAPLAKSLAGQVCVNESLSRRLSKSQRMVYIDWEDDNVGFLCGCVSIHVPRFLRFDRSRRVRPFYTEFAVYQRSNDPVLTNPSIGDPIENSEALPEVICSKIARIYNYEGKLKQGVTSFFTLQRFGDEGE